MSIRIVMDDFELDKLSDEQLHNMIKYLAQAENELRTVVIACQFEKIRRLNRIQTASNPSGKSHEWLKKRFISPKVKKDPEDEIPSMHDFLNAKYV